MRECTADEEWMNASLGPFKSLSRPWCCPEPSCTLLHNDQVEATPTPGVSFICFGRMKREVAFTYDGETHASDLNHCDYTPLKGIIRWQENVADWRYILEQYNRALRTLRGRRR